MNAYLRVWAGIARQRRCRSCRLAIVFRLTTRGKWVPVNRDAFVVRHEAPPSGHTLSVEVLPGDATHFEVCAARSRQRRSRGQSADAGAAA